jgi:hypothetical protein
VVIEAGMRRACVLLAARIHLPPSSSRRVDFFLIEVVCGEIHLRLPNGFRAALTRLQDRPDHQDQRGGDQTSRHDELFRPSGEAPGKLDVSLQPSPRFIH